MLAILASFLSFLFSFPPNEVLLLFLTGFEEEAVTGEGSTFFFLFFYENFLHHNF